MNLNEESGESLQANDIPLEREMRTIKSETVSNDDKLESQTSNIIEPEVNCNSTFQLKSEMLAEDRCVESNENICMKQELLHEELDIKNEDEESFNRMSTLDKWKENILPKQKTAKEEAYARFEESQKEKRSNREVETEKIKFALISKNLPSTFKVKIFNRRVGSSDNPNIENTGVNSNLITSGNHENGVAMPYTECPDNTSDKGVSNIIVNPKNRQNKKKKRTKVDLQLQRKINAEKKRQYRARVKADPERLEKSRAYERERNRKRKEKGELKPIAEKEACEIKRQRKIWREASKKYYNRERAERKIEEFDLCSFLDSGPSPSSESRKKAARKRLRKNRYKESKVMMPYTQCPDNTSDKEVSNIIVDAKTRPNKKNKRTEVDLQLQRKINTEKKRQYRARVKADPERLEKSKAYERERNRKRKEKGELKPIAEKGAREKKRQRNMWREASKKYYHREREERKIEEFNHCSPDSFVDSGPSPLSESRKKAERKGLRDNRYKEPKVIMELRRKLARANRSSEKWKKKYNRAIANGHTKKDSEENFKTRKRSCQM